MANIGETGLSELDKLIHNFEFENQQLVKMIEKENELINGLQVNIESTRSKTEIMEKEIIQMDHDTKRLHRQYTANRETNENLKITRSVLIDHEIALNSQLDRLRIEAAEKRKFYAEHLANYEATYQDYMKKYKSFPLAIELENLKTTLENKKADVATLEKNTEILEQEIAEKERKLSSRGMHNLVVSIAEIKVDTLRMEKEIQLCEAEKTKKLEKLQEMQASKQSEVTLQEESQMEHEEIAANVEEDKSISCFTEGYKESVEDLNGSTDLSSQEGFEVREENFESHVIPYDNYIVRSTSSQRKTPMDIIENDGEQSPTFYVNQKPNDSMSTPAKQEPMAFQSPSERTQQNSQQLSSRKMQNNSQQSRDKSLVCTMQTQHNEKQSLPINLPKQGAQSTSLGNPRITPNRPDPRLSVLNTPGPRVSVPKLTPRLQAPTLSVPRIPVPKLEPRLSVPSLPLTKPPVPRSTQRMSVSNPQVPRLSVTKPEQRPAVQNPSVPMSPLQKPGARLSVPTMPALRKPTPRPELRSPVPRLSATPRPELRTQAPRLSAPRLALSRPEHRLSVPRLSVPRSSAPQTNPRQCGPRMPRLPSSQPVRSGGNLRPQNVQPPSSQPPRASAPQPQRPTLTVHMPNLKQLSPKASAPMMSNFRPRLTRANLTMPQKPHAPQQACLRTMTPSGDAMQTPDGKGQKRPSPTPKKPTVPTAKTLNIVKPLQQVKSKQEPMNINDSTEPQETTKGGKAFKLSQPVESSPMQTSPNADAVFLEPASPSLKTKGDKQLDEPDPFSFNFNFNFGDNAESSPGGSTEGAGFTGFTGFNFGAENSDESMKGPSLFGAFNPQENMEETSENTNGASKNMFGTAVMSQNSDAAQHGFPFMAGGAGGAGDDGNDTDDNFLGTGKTDKSGGSFFNFTGNSDESNDAGGGFFANFKPDSPDEESNDRATFNLFG